MNKNGFTLVELLAVIAILAIISTIAGFSYTKVMKDNKIKQCEQKILYIEKQAIKYASDFNVESSILLDDLINAGYLIDDVEDNDTMNPLTEKKFGGQVTISKTNGLISAEYIPSAEYITKGECHE